MNQIKSVDRGDEAFFVVESYVESEYVKKGFVKSFVNSPDLYFVATMQDAIVGAIGLFTADGFDNLPSIRGPTPIYVPTNGLLRGHRLSGLVVEIGRLVVTANNSNVSKALIVSMHRYLMSRGYLYGIACMKDYLVEHLSNIGITLNKYPSRLATENIPDEYEGYFNNDPAPELFYFDLLALSDPIEKISNMINGRDTYTFTLEKNAL